MPKGRKAPPPAAIPLEIPIPAPMQPAAGQQNGAIAVAQQAEREAVIGLLAEQPTPAQARQVAQHASWFAAQLVDQLVDTSAIACRAGCSWCCSLFVSATAPEILLIADYLRATYSTAQLAALRERLAEREQLIAGTTAKQRSAARRPCVLLVDGSCSVYPVRPLACGSWTSTNAKRCEESWRRHWATTITSNQLQLWLYGGVMLGLREGLDACDLPAEQLDLTIALRIALDTPDADARWLAGEPIFAPAQVEVK